MHLHIKITFKELIFNQYTGLKDKHGVEIYEGDVVRYVFEAKEPEYTTQYEEVVEFTNGHFNCELTPLYAIVDWSCKVIGNIYQNPELLNP